MKEKLKQKFIEFYRKSSIMLDTLIVLLWIVTYSLFCFNPSLKLLGICLTYLIILETNYIYKKISLKEDIFNNFDRLISYSREILEQNKNLQKEMLPFKDEYFKNLSSDVIAELAKTSLRVGMKTQEYLHALEDIKDCLTELDVSNTHISRALNKIDEVIDENIQ